MEPVVHFPEGREEAGKARIVAGRRGAVAAEISRSEDGTGGGHGATHRAVLVGTLRDGGVAIDPESEAHIRSGFPEAGPGRRGPPCSGVDM